VHERRVAEKEAATALDGPGAASIEGDEGKKVELLEK